MKWQSSAPADDAAGGEEIPFVQMRKDAEIYGLQMHRVG